MKSRLISLTAAVCLLLLCTGASIFDEGMWLLDSVEKLPLSTFRGKGLELSPAEIYSTGGPSLKDAIVLLPGGTGGFISSQGLIVTNHHIAFAGIQELSSVQEDYLKNGFLAQTKSNELSTSYTAETVVSMKEITAEVLTAVNDTMSPDRRAKAIRNRMTELQNSASEQDGLTYRASELYNGVKYYLFGFEVLKDVRLVYAPPGSIGNYGGEVDNWTWPRHTGDFALMRAYVGPDGKAAPYAPDNIPYTPRVFFPVSSRGAVEGHIAIVMGFPGTTVRYRELDAVILAQEETLPMTVDLNKLRMDVIEEFGRNDRAVEIKYASKLRRLANFYKKNIGVLEGMKRSGFVDLKKKETEELKLYIANTPQLFERYGDVIPAMQAATREYRRINKKNLLLSNVRQGVELFGLANRFIGYAENPPKDSLGKVIPYTDKERKSLREFIGTMFKDHDSRVDREMLVRMILKSASLPEADRILHFDKIVGSRTGSGREQRVREYVDDLYRETMLTSPDRCEKLLRMDSDDILDDPFVRLARAVATEQEPVTAKVTAYSTTIGQLRAKYVAALLAWRNSPVSYPDANRTLRFTYGLVESLAPRDAVVYAAFTTLGGLIEKETGEDPFDVPPRLKQLWEQKDFGKYADHTLGDVPVAFIANLDITGGNSGSPVINGKGELIGCAFDGNWEAVVGDYLFQHRYNRSINVDSRYMLFVLDKFAGASHIIQELDIR